MEKIITIDGKSRRTGGLFFGKIDGIPVVLNARGIDIYEDGFIEIAFDTGSASGLPSQVYFEYNEFMDKLATGEFVTNEEDWDND